MTYEMETLSESCVLSDNRLQVLENTTSTLAIAFFNVLQTLKTRINSHKRY